MDALEKAEQRANIQLNKPNIKTGSCPLCNGDLVEMKLNTGLQWRCTSFTNTSENAMSRCGYSAPIGN